MSEPHGNPSDLHSHGSSHHAAAPPEPKTPMWLPALGVVLFLAAGLVFSLMPSSSDDAGANEGSNAADASAAGQN